MIEREELASRVNKIMETYLSDEILGNNKQNVFVEFYNKLVEPQNFKEEGLGLLVPSPSGRIKLNMTPNHIKKYFKILTEKLIDYKEIIKKNKRECKNYKTPQIELTKAAELARGAFYESYTSVKDSYKQNKNEKQGKEKYNLSDVLNKKPKDENELTPEDADRLRELQELYL